MKLSATAFRIFPGVAYTINALYYKLLRFIDETGYVSLLGMQCLLLILTGAFRHQAVSIERLFQEAKYIGVQAVVIVATLCFAVGVMLAVQGIETLKTFGAESKVVVGIALSVCREFSPLIVGILVAGRSGSAIAARIASMHESQEIDALQVMGISPIRYLAAPIFLAMMLMLPVLTILGDLFGILGGGLLTQLKLGLEINVYLERSLQALSVNDILQGIIKSLAFAMIIALIGIANGFQIKGGAEGIGRATTRAVVSAISLIIIADMIFTFILN